jgi:penicillin G amidase
LILRRIIWATVLLAAGAGSYRVQFKSIRSLPGFALMFSPTDGILRNPPERRANTKETISLKGSSQPIHVQFDERAVPHISAANDTDLYRAQGYLVARERLFEMDVSARAPLGRLAEIFGKSQIEADVHMRQLGLAQGARTLEKSMSEDPDTASMVNAYSEGVNAWIDEAKHSPHKRPIEYWLLGAEPEPWSPLKTAAIVKIMGWRMSGSELENELKRTAALADLGKEAFESIFDAAFQAPATYPHWAAKEAPPAATSETTPPVIGTFKLAVGEIPSRLNGSNSWAIAGARTMSGHPILANDPHLGLHLPSIWYEQHLKSPDQNTYGVAVPGVPAILIGFNNDIAWGITNAGIDALDIYKMELTTEQQNAYYRQDDALEPLENFEEVLRVKNESEVRFPTYWSPQGPVIAGTETKSLDKPEKSWLAVHWTGHFPSNEPGALRTLNHSKSCDSIPRAFQSFATPLLNLSCIDRAGTISTYLIGKVPNRRNDGRFVSDGRLKSSVWTDFMAAEQTPYSKNPDSQILLSANQNPQFPIPPSFRGNFATAERSGQIARTLDATKHWTIDRAKKLQSNTEGMAAEILLPAILRPLLPLSKQSDLDRSLIEALNTWDNTYRKSLIAPTIFEVLYTELANGIWSSRMKTEDWRQRYPIPNRQITWQALLALSAQDTPAEGAAKSNESFDNLVRDAYAKAKEQLISELGDDPLQWTWSRYRKTDIAHLTKLALLGLRRPISTDGSGDTVNAITSNHGPSWRMIVEMTPDGPIAYGVYPGGQSGHPGSIEYSQFMKHWEDGELYRLHFDSNLEITENN